MTAGSAASPISVRLHRLPVGSAELARQVEAFRRQLAARDLDFQRSAQNLYDLLLAPAAPELKGKNALSLRRAALAIRRQERYRHPFYWAPFVLVGDGG